MSQQLVNALTLSSIYILFTLGLSLAFGVVKILNLAHGAIFMSCALGAYLLTDRVVLPLAVVLPLTIAGGALLTLAVDWLAFRPIRRRVPNARQAELSMLIASVGITSILVSIADNLLKGDTRHIDQRVFKVTTLKFAGVRVTNLQFLIFFVGIGTTVALALWVKRSNTGRALRALAHDAPTCALMGVNADVLTTLTMVISGGLAGGAGVLLALNFNAVESAMGENLLLKAFAIIILGGAGSMGGAVLGGVVLAFAETMTVAYVSPSYRDAIAFGLILLLLLVRPEGLLSRGRVERA